MRIRAEKDYWVWICFGRYSKWHLASRRDQAHGSYWRVKCNRDVIAPADVKFVEPVESPVVRKNVCHTCFWMRREHA